MGGGGAGIYVCACVCVKGCAAWPSFCIYIVCFIEPVQRKPV